MPVRQKCKGCGLKVGMGHRADCSELPTPENLARKKALEERLKRLRKNIAKRREKIAVKEKESKNSK